MRVAGISYDWQDSKAIGESPVKSGGRNEAVKEAVTLISVPLWLVCLSLVLVYLYLFICLLKLSYLYLFFVCLVLSCFVLS